MTQNRESRSSTGGVRLITEALAAPFDLDDIKFKPQVVKNNRAMAIAYVDARAIQDRLDAVLGVEGWQDEYTPLPDGSVICRLSVRLGEVGDKWITKMDVGSRSDRPDGGNKLKAAFSDALKRAAVKFGIGRYLYRVQAIWCDYDPQKKQIKGTPALPAFALPAKTDQPAPAGKIRSATAELPAASPSGSVKHQPPSDGRELLQRLRDYDAKLAEQGKCTKGALLQHITQQGVKAGHGSDLASWIGPAIKLAVEQTKTFEAGLRRAKPSQKAVA